MVKISAVFDAQNFNRDDYDWRSRQNFHMYEDAVRAQGVGGGFFGPMDNAGAWNDFEFRLAKARALDQARQAMLEEVHRQKADVFGFAFVERSVDGVEGAPDDAIKF